MLLNGTSSSALSSCPVCGGSKFELVDINWAEWQNLIQEWQLSAYEVDYISRQQGLLCADCKANLRSMALANGLCRIYDHDGLFEKLVQGDILRRMRILEINEAGTLTPYLSQIPGYVFGSYPALDMMDMSQFAEGSFDLIVHSDTLEHVTDPVRALSECRRILSKGGFCCFTVPVVVDRMTISRAGMPKSYHGPQDSRLEDFCVFTEYGCDFWKHPVLAGFRETRLAVLEYPSALALACRK